MALPWMSRFVYGVGDGLTTWDLTLPIRPWRRVTATIGGSRTAAGGVPASHIVRRDYLLWLTLRVYETERPDLDALIEWGQSSESLLWYPDQEETTVYEVYLEHPVAGEDLEDQRSDEFPSVIEATICLRRVDAYAWSLDYFACEDD
jgi:hypothetical protein